MRPKAGILILSLAAVLAVCSNTAAQTESYSFAEQSNSLAAVRLPYKERVVQALDSLCAGELFTETQLGLMVYDLDDNRVVYSLGEKQLLRPASTMKLLTAITALDLLGKNYRYRTALYHTGSCSPTTLYGDIYIRGMMDPSLESADVDHLVEGITALHIDTIRGNIIGDRSFMDGEPLGKGWCWDDDNPTLSPLVYREKDDLTEVVRQKLTNLGIVVIGCTSTGATPEDASLLSERYSTLRMILTPMLKHSENLYAESVLYNIGGATHVPATAAAAQASERDIIRLAGLNAEDYSLADGSGLSLYNYLSAECEVALLRYAYYNINVYPTLLESLPIAGVDGTLKRRMLGTAAQGNVHAKTGTLTGISSLAGYCTSPEGHTIAFSIINQGIMQRHAAHAFQDAVCIVLCE